MGIQSLIEEEWSSFLEGRNTGSIFLLSLEQESKSKRYQSFNFSWSDPSTEKEIWIPILAAVLFPSQGQGSQVGRGIHVVPHGPLIGIIEDCRRACRSEHLWPR